MTKATSPTEQVDFERYEAKYIIHPSLVPQIREFIQPFCIPDPNTSGDIPEYTLTTLQLDSPDLALYRASREEAINRFKLRVRAYGTEPKGPIFMEVKRRIKGVVVKSRCMIPREFFGPQLASPRRTQVPPFRTRRERSHFIEFTRLMDMLGARPVMLIRYTRESYFGSQDSYARLTFDRKLCYSPTRNWDVQPRNVKWWAMDSSEAMDRPFSGLVLEMKTYRDTPQWMVELTQRFSLVRTGFCKYALAMRLESQFTGLPSTGLENYMYSAVGG